MVHILILQTVWKGKNPKNDDNKCFQYAATIALNYKEILEPRKSSNIKPFINSYNWEGINYPPKTEDWKRFEKKNLTIALNVLYMKETAYISNINSNCEK